MASIFRTCLGFKKSWLILLSISAAAKITVIKSHASECKLTAFRVRKIPISLPLDITEELT